MSSFSTEDSPERRQDTLTHTTPSYLSARHHGIFPFAPSKSQDAMEEELDTLLQTSPQRDTTLQPATKRRKGSMGFIHESRPPVSTSPSSASSVLSSQTPRGTWSLRYPSGRLSGNIAELHYQCMDEVQKRETCERKLASLKEKTAEYQQQNQILRQETRCLQSDNAVLIRQLEDQSISLSSLTFDAERYKTCLEDHHIPVPVSLYYEVSARAKIPRLCLQSGSLPVELLDSATLTAEEKANFATIQALVNTVKELQVRLRDSRVTKLSIADERVAELEATISGSNALIHELKTSRDLVKSQYEEDIRAVVKKNDVLVAKILAKDAEIEALLNKTAAMEKKEAQRYEELKVEELEQKLESLTTVLEQKAVELATLRAENSSLTAASVVTQKELEYFNTSLARERQQSDTLRVERDSLYDEVNSARSLTAQHSTETIMLQSRVQVLERSAKAREVEIEEWRDRFLEAQEKLVEEQSRWDRALQESLAKVTRSEMAVAAAQERVDHMHVKVEEKEKELESVRQSHQVVEKTIDSELQAAKVALSTETVAREAALQKIVQLERQLSSAIDERQIIASRIEAVEAQAAILKGRHPQLDFGVMEDELRRFETEKSELVAEVEELRSQNEEVNSIAESREEMINQLRATLESQKASLQAKEEEVTTTTDQLTGMRTQLDQAECMAAETFDKMLALQDMLDQTQSQLSLKENETQHLNREMESFRKGESEKLKHLKIELEDAKRELTRVHLDMESVSQGHRLEIQAHFRDLQRLEAFQLSHRSEKERYENDIAKLETKLKEADVKIGSLAVEVSDIRRRAEAAEALKRQTDEENAQIRKLLHDKLDIMELSDDDVKTHLAEQLRIEESLKREVDRARIEAERVTLELRAAQFELDKLRVKMNTSAAEIERLQEERDLSPTSRTTEDESQARLASDLQLRVTRLETDLKHSMELRRVAEKRLNELINETEPLKRREALLQGEVASLRNMLQVTEKDAEVYKKKYLELTRGLHQDLEVQKADLENKVTVLETKKSELEVSLSQTTQQLHHMNAEKLTLKSEAERMNKETITLKSQLQSAQSQLEQLQSHRPKINNVDIQRKYQQQLSNLQRLIQQVNAEKEQLKAELSTSLETIVSKQSQIEGMERKIEETQAAQRAAKVVRQGQAVPAEDVPSSAMLASLSGILDEAVKVGILSSLLVGRNTTEQCHPATVILQSSKPPPPSPSNKIVDAPSPRTQNSSVTDIPTQTALFHNPLLTEESTPSTSTAERHGSSQPDGLLPFQGLTSHNNPSAPIACFSHHNTISSTSHTEEVETIDLNEVEEVRNECQFENKEFHEQQQQSVDVPLFSVSEGSLPQTAIEAYSSLVLPPLEGQQE